MKLSAPNMGIFTTLLRSSLIAAQQTISNRPLPDQPAVLTIENVLRNVGIANFNYKDSINVGGLVGVLYEQASSDTNLLEILFKLKGNGDIVLKTTWDYYTPKSSQNIFYPYHIADPANSAALVDENKAVVIVDTSQPVSIRNDRGQIRFFAKNGHTYILDMFYGADNDNYYLVFTAPDNFSQ